MLRKLVPYLPYAGAILLLIAGVADARFHDAAARHAYTQCAPSQQTVAAGTASAPPGCPVLVTHHAPAAIAAKASQHS